jgi:hypothetical protein
MENQEEANKKPTTQLNQPGQPEPFFFGPLGHFLNKFIGATEVFTALFHAVQAVLLHRLQNAKYRLDSAGQLP